MNSNDDYSFVLIAFGYSVYYSNICAVVSECCVIWRKAGTELLLGKTYVLSDCIVAVPKAA